MINKSPLVAQQKKMKNRARAALVARKKRPGIDIVNLRLDKNIAFSETTVDDPDDSSKERPDDLPQPLGATTFFNRFPVSTLFVTIGFLLATLSAVSSFYQL